MSAVRATALRAGGACVRCRKGKTKCVYENGRAPCKNCSKGMHECYLPSESMSHGGHGVSPARAARARDNQPSERTSGSATADRHASAHPTPAASRSSAPASEKLGPDMLEQCERVINKVLPACVAFHRPSFIQTLRNNNVDSVMVNALLCTAARHSPTLIQRFGRGQGPTQAAEHFGLKSSNHIWLALDHPTLADIQALCLMVIHEWGSRSAVRAYIYLGQAARMAQMYRVVHNNGHSNDPDRFLQEESFRRTLWLIFILDCFLTSSPGRFPALSALDVKDVALPCEDMNFNFGNPVYVRTLDGNPPPAAPSSATMGPVGEFGHIVLATEAWRMVVEMMTTTTLETFSEEQCQMLEVKVAQVRNNLPLPFADRPGQMELHITMGSGVTYAMIHLLLHCATIFINRRRLLQIVTSETFSMEAWRMSAQNQMQYVERILESSHSIISMLTALERATESTAVCCLPIFMLFAGFTAGSTVAYLALKGLSPPHTHESIHIMVDKCLNLMKDGAESWNLVVPWHRHLSVMNRVLNDANSGDDQESTREEERMHIQRSPSVKDETVTSADAHHDVMDYEQAPTSDASKSAPQGDAPRGSPAGDLPQAVPSAPMEGRESEPPRPRPAGVTTINGGPTRGTSPALASPQAGPQHAKPDYSPNPLASESGASGSVPPPARENGTSPSRENGTPPTRENGSSVDMTPMELCAAFERQLLELDDLAAFMGGGV